MKYIVPLFRQNTGRVNLGLVNWDSFQAGFRMVMRGDRFARVTWNPWWRERSARERREGQRRTIPERRSHDKVGHRLSSEEEIFQVLRLVHDRRANEERRNGSERRNSASHEKVVGLTTVIRGLRESSLSDENALLMIRICAGLTNRETYEGWIRISGMAPFFTELDWDAKENHQKFKVYAVASFLELLQPGAVYWKGQSPSADHLNSVSRIVSILGRASEKSKLQAIRAFFMGEIGLDGMRKILSGESLSDKKELLQLVWANRKLKPKAFHEKLRDPLSDMGFDLSPKPGSYRKQIERLKKDAELYIASLSR